MATLRDIKRRITAVKNTQQITKAMKMVAAARLRRAQENIINARPYSKKISEVLGNLLSLQKDYRDALSEKREIKNVSIVVITSDRGLCGAFNMNVIREVETLIKTDYKDVDVSLYCIGKKGFDYFNRKKIKIENSHVGIFSGLKFEFASRIVGELTSKFLNNQTDKVIIAFNEFKSVIQQKVIIKQFLPVEIYSESESEKLSGEFIFEPNKAEIIKTLFPKYLKASMWTALLDSYAAELGARMTAMDMATENAKELIKSLNLTYNKKRQASITSEILEIVGGANALKES
ncbi:MAG: F0F1 ATP synthase subunit gamma [Ignavibacteriales bacterium]